MQSPSARKKNKVHSKKHLDAKYPKTITLSELNKNVCKRKPFRWQMITDQDSQTVIKALKKGYPVSVFDQLKEKLDISEKKLAVLVNIAPRTLTRRKKTGRLNSDESERILRIIRLFGHAVDILGDEEEAKRWFMAPNYGLGDTPPLEYADTEPGAREVEKLLGRLEWGVFT